MKKVLSMLLALALLLMAVPVGVMPVAAATGNTTEFAGGSGTAEDPYLISTVDHLDNVRYYLSAHFKMINDIEFVEEDFAEGGDFYNNGVGWEPIGYTTDSFTGIFDGNCHTINNLFINNSKDYIGFFGTISGESAVVKNLYLSNVSITGSACTGGIAGRVMSATISHCYVEGAIHGTNDVGGVVGTALETSEIDQCTVKGQISGSDNVGGICGNINPYIKSSVDSSTNINQCQNMADVSGVACVGGIAGRIYTTYAYSTTWVQGTYGGSSYTRIDWYSPKYVSIANCYNRGKITGTGDYVAGIIGYASERTGPYKNSDSNIHRSSLINSYNCGNVSTLDLSGEAVVSNNKRLTISNSYYLSGCAETSKYGIEKTHNQMRTKDSFTGFNFDSIWTINGEKEYLYPELQCFTLNGEPKITGNIAYNSVVSLAVSTIEELGDMFTYNWYAENELVGFGASYHISANDIGKVLQVEVVSDHAMNVGALISEGVIVSKAVQPDQPVVPELLMLDDNSFEITTNSNQEYSIDNVNWQSSGVFENLDPNQDYTVYSRVLENDLYLLGESAPVLNVTTDRRPLYGTVSLVGTSRFGDTLTVDVSGVMPENATYTYEWKANGIVVGTGSTYKIAQDDIGKNITLSVKGNGDFIGTLTSASVTATKATVQLPNAPTIEETTNTTVKLIEKANYEYSKDGAIWQDSPLFEGLSAATEYTFYQRVKETETTFASKSSSGTKVTTLKNNVAAPEKPVVEKVTNTTVTLKLLTGYEYSLDGLTWQKSNVFTGLSPNTEYSFCQRIAENQTDYASAQSGYTIVVTLKNTVAAPGAPKIEKATATSVTLVNTAGYEYSIDGKVWQTNNVFTGLTTLKTYTFYQRIKETNTDYTSATSAGTSFKVKYVADAPAAPTLTEKTNNKIAVAVQTGYEYSINKTMWTTTGVFTGLQPNQAYTVYCRIPETDTHYASAVSNALTVTTHKNTVSAPAAPVLSSKTDVSVTLVANSACEYSMNGGTWQKSNVFAGLSPNTEYTFYQRKAETSTDFASEKSNGLKVRTHKKTIAAPAAPTLAQKTATSVTLTKINGYEYSKDGAKWQTDNVFTDLQANTQYAFYQRVAETETAFASDASGALKVTTPKSKAYAVPKPVLVETTQTTVQLEQINAFEYSVDGKNWQDSATFTGLNINTTYTFYQRVRETHTMSEGPTSPGLIVTTKDKGENLNTPLAPSVVFTGSSKVTLLQIDGYEYKMGNGNWQSSPQFEGLESSTTYTFYQRIKETDATKASASSKGTTVTTIHYGLSTTACHLLLRSYIEEKGTTQSNGRKAVAFWSGNYYYKLQLSDNSVFCSMEHYVKQSALEAEVVVAFSLFPDVRDIPITMLRVMYYEGAKIGTYEGTSSIDRATYDTNMDIPIDGNFEVGSQMYDVFNSEFKVLLLQVTLFAMEEINISPYYLGFFELQNPTFEKNFCDNATNYHVGKKVVKNQYAATCEYNGYSGDYVCDHCGITSQYGNTIPAKGGHVYSGSCDADCNTCGWVKEVVHTYSDICDESCNVCDATRTAAHTYDTICDAYCNECNAERKPPHVYDNSDDLFCNACGYERPPYIPGDLDGDDVVTDADAVHLLFYTFFPEDYALNQDCDFDGDGTVNDADAVYLLFYTFFPEDYPVV